MILTAGKLNVEKLLAGDAAGKKVAYVAVGTSSAAVAATDSALSNQISAAINNIEYLPDNNILFTAVLPSTVPAMTILEIGLLNTDNILVHRKVLDAPKQKASGQAYSIKYQIKVV